jgi:hypothetical protein
VKVDETIFKMDEKKNSKNNKISADRHLTTNSVDIQSQARPGKNEKSVFFAFYYLKRKVSVFFLFRPNYDVHLTHFLFEIGVKRPFFTPVAAHSQDLR